MLIPHIVLIVPDEEARKEFCHRLDNAAYIHTAITGLDGLASVRKHQPAIVIIDNDLPDIQGMSVASILKDSPKEHSIVYLLNVIHLSLNVKADRFAPKPYSIELVCQEVYQDLQSILDMTDRSKELQEAIDMQSGMLPPPLRNEHCFVDCIFSPYKFLSGDGLSYWYADSGGVARLYGFLYDCVGHELASYGQTSSLHWMLKKAMNFYQAGVFSSLSAAMEDINRDLFTLYDNGNSMMASAIIFCFDFNRGLLRFCPAAIHEFLWREKGTEKYKARHLQSSWWGYEITSSFSEETVNLSGLSHIMFTTDGLSDLLCLSGPPEVDMGSAKFDDCAAIFVELGSEFSGSFQKKGVNVTLAECPIKL